MTDFSTIEIRKGSGGWQSRRGPGPAGWTDFAGILLRNFAAAVEGREALLVDAGVAHDDGDVGVLEQSRVPVGDRHHPPVIPVGPVQQQEQPDGA